ncbi:Zn finger protein [Rhizina undulata]
MPYTAPQPPARLPQYATNNTSPPPSQSDHQPTFTSPPSLLLSHHLPAPCRQLHPPKSPLYRPAVLRSTGRPLRAPPTSPASSAASVNEEYMNAGSGEYKNALGIVINRGGYSSGIDNDLIEEEETGRVTGPPDRGHWKPDAEAPVCDAPMCVRNFSLVTRRHHCRRCGNVFCAQHTPHYLPLNQNAKFHPQGLPSRACDSCYNDYHRMLTAKRTDSLSSNSSSSSTISNGNHMPSSPIVNMGSRGVNAGGRGPMSDAELGTKMGSYVGSVPRDWSWSTF